MKDLRQALLGVAAALLTSLILFGALSLSFVESGSWTALLPSSTARPTLPLVIITSAPGEPTFTPLPTPEPTSTPTPFPTPAECPPPPGWQAYIIQPDDTLPSLAAIYGVTPADLAAGNCLLTGSLISGSRLYVPPLPPTATPTATTVPSPTHTEPSIPPAPPTTCGPPAGWVRYTVKVGDTLYGLSLVFNTSVAQLQRANCLPGSSIRVGQLLWVPFIPPTRTPSATYTPSFTQTPSVTPSIIPPSPRPPTLPPTQPPVPTATPLPPTAPPTATPSGTPSATPTLTATVTPTSTREVTPTFTPTFTATPVPPTLPVPPTVTPTPQDG